MQQFSPQKATPTLDKQDIEMLGFKTTPVTTRHDLAKQLVPYMQQFIDNKVPKVNDVERVVLLLQMLNLILPGQPLPTDK